MPKQTKRDLWLNAEILRLSGEGLFADVIADMLQIDMRQVHDRARRNDIHLNHKRGNRKRVLHKLDNRQAAKSNPHDYAYSNGKSVALAGNRPGRRPGERNEKPSPGFAPVTKGLVTGTHRMTDKKGQDRLHRWLRMKDGSTKDAAERNNSEIAAKEAAARKVRHLAWLKKRKRIAAWKQRRQQEIDAAWKSREAELDKHTKEAP